MGLTLDDKVMLFKERNLAIVTTKNGAALVSSAKSLTYNIFNTILNYCRGGVTMVVMSKDRAVSFGLDAPPQKNNTFDSNDFYTTVDAKVGISTGISVKDRVITINILGGDELSPDLLAKPGHVFPVVTANGGVMSRPALPEAAQDLVNFAGMGEVAVCMELLDDTGSLLSPQQQLELANILNLPYFTLQEVVALREEAKNT